MDAGICAACHTPLGEISLDGVLGLFPRVRCPACGLVNVITQHEGETPAAARSALETSFAIGIEPAPEPEPEPEVNYEEPSAAYDGGYDQPSPAYDPEQHNYDGGYDQPDGVIPADDNFVPESTRINIDAPEEDEK